MISAGKLYKFQDRLNRYSSIVLVTYVKKIPPLYVVVGWLDTVSKKHEEKTVDKFKLKTFLEGFQEIESETKT